MDPVMKVTPTGSNFGRREILGSVARPEAVPIARHRDESRDTPFAHEDHRARPARQGGAEVAAAEGRVALPRPALGEPLRQVLRVDRMSSVPLVAAQIFQVACDVVSRSLSHAF